MGKPIWPIPFCRRGGVVLDDGSQSIEGPAPLPEGTPVTVRLKARFNDLPEEDVLLLENTWSSHDLAGRQLRIGLQPAMELETLLMARVGDIRTVIPSFAIQALDQITDGSALFAEEGPLAPVQGDAISLEGNRIAVGEDGAVLVNGQESLLFGDPDAAEQVTTIDVTVDSSRFPVIKLEAMPRDASGAVVEGLTLQDMALSEEGAPVTATLTKNQLGHRVLLLTDTSFSMPEEYRTTQSDTLSTLISNIRQSIEEIDPRATISAQDVNSDIWGNLKNLSAAPFDLIIYVTDGDHVGASFDEGVEAALRAGPSHGDV